MALTFFPHPLLNELLSLRRRVWDTNVPRAERTAVSASLQHDGFWFFVNHHVPQQEASLKKKYIYNSLRVGLVICPFSRIITIGSPMGSTS